MSTSDKNLIGRAVEAWPDGVLLAAVRADRGKSQAKASGRTLASERDLLRSAGWTAGAAGWWTLEGAPTAPTAPGVRVASQMKAGARLDNKRTKLDGCILQGSCPECGETVTRDLGDHYLSYPRVNTPITLTMYHGDCPRNPAGIEWEVRVQLNITVQALG